MFVCVTVCFSPQFYNYKSRASLHLRVWWGFWVLCLATSFAVSTGASSMSGCLLLEAGYVTVDGKDSSSA